MTEYDDDYTVPVETNEELNVTNYWKLCNTEIEPILKGIRQPLLLIHHSAEFEHLLEPISKIQSSRQILYVSLTKSFSSMHELIEKRRLNLFVVDCVTKSLIETPSIQSPICEFVETPSDPDKMFVIIQDMISKVSPDYIVIDSLSYFIDFSKGGDTGKKLYDFSDKITRMNSTAKTKIILLYDETISSDVGHIPNIYFQNIIKFDVARKKVIWRG